MKQQQDVRIRLARLHDAPAIAAVHVRAWQTAYRGIVPDSYLDTMDLAAREERWQERLAHPSESEFTFVAELTGHTKETPGAIIGFASGGPERNSVAGYDGELYGIYLLPEHRGKGIGRRLVAATAKWLSERGTQSLVIWVLKENLNGRAFYEALGGQLVSEQTITIGGSSLLDVAYGWPDLRMILHASRDAGGDSHEAAAVR